MDTPPNPYAPAVITPIVGDARHVLPGLPDACIDAIITDPPYELGFMGKSWDATGIAYDVALWAECLRVLKPGGHLAAFGGTRTYHRMACAVEDAGFEIRDSLTWLYGSGFPKSLDVSKAIDKTRDDNSERRAVGAWLRAQREAAGLRQKDVSKHWPSATGGLTGCVANWEHGFNLPTWEQWLRLRDLIGFGGEMDAEVWRLNGRKGTPGNERPDREVSGRAANEVFQPTQRVINAGAPVLDAARTWQGFGTALKPAQEPIVLARKPLTGTVAANTLAHGVGGLNIDATRVDSPVLNSERRTSRSGVGSVNGVYNAEGWSREAERVRGERHNPAGRWPSNVLLSHSQHAWYALRHDVDPAAQRAVLAFYGAEQAVHSVRGTVQGNAVGSGSAEVLQPGVRWGQSSRQAQGGMGRPDLRGVLDSLPGDARVVSDGTTSVLLGGVPTEGHATGPNGDGALGRGPAEDVRRGNGEVPAGELVAVEGRPLPGPGGLLARDDRDAAGRDASTDQPTEAAVRAGAPSGGGTEDRAPDPHGRGGASPQRREGGQPTGKSNGGSTLGSQRRAPADRAGVPGVAGRGDQAAGGERRLEVRSDLIPPGWVDLFEYVAEECADVCAPGCPVAELDAQSGMQRDGAAVKAKPGRGGPFGSIGQGTHDPQGYGGQGGASRYFPTFRYQAKAPTRERPKINGVAHETVKPLALMQWLVRLLCPPGGTVLDPFVGSGTTIEASMIEGMRVIGIESDPQYVPHILHRIDRAWTRRPAV